MRKKFVLLMLITLLPFCAYAETVHISNLISIVFDIPEGWVQAKEPPQPMLEIFAEHIGHEAEEKGHSPSHEQLIEAAQKRLKTNDVILYNPNTNAHMLLDMSPLRRGEKAPSKNSIRLSAKYAGQSLEQEEGVTNLTGQSSAFSIPGAWYAYRYDADYLHHDEKMRFSGVVGFISPYWFYYYHTNYLKDPADLEKAEKIFKTLHIIKRES